MVYQRIHKSSSWNPPSQEKSSQFAPRPFAVQAQQDSRRTPTQEEIENKAFNQTKFEALGLQLKDQHGTITPVEREKLGELQAKMDDFWVQRKVRTKAQPNLLEILIRNSEATQTTESQAPVQRAGGVPVNDDAALEHEADVMGAKALASADHLAGGPAEADRLQRKFETVQIAGDPAEAELLQGKSIRFNEGERDKMTWWEAYLKIVYPVFKDKCQNEQDFEAAVIRELKEYDETEKVFANERTFLKLLELKFTTNKPYENKNEDPDPDSKEEASYHRAYDRALVVGSIILNGMQFGGSGETRKYNNKRWKKGKDNEGDEILILESGKPSEAINDIFENPKEWSLDCIEYLQVLRWYAQLKAKGAERFDKDINMQSFKLSYHSSTGLNSRVFYSRESKNSVFTAKEEKTNIEKKTEIVLNTEEKEDEFLTTLPIGSRVMWSDTSSDAEGEDFENENAIKIAKETYAAHPYGVLSPDELRDEMADGSNAQEKAEYISEYIYIQEMEVYART